MILLALTVTFAITQTADLSRDRMLLTEGVGPITAPGAVPGPVVASGRNSIVVLTGNADGAKSPLVVAARIGSGRVVVAGHGGFYGDASLKNESNARFFSNAISWLSGKSKGAKVGLLGHGGLGDAVTKAGGAPVSLKESNLADSLPSLDVLVMGQQALDGEPKAQEAVMKFVKAGGGLMVDGPAWGWQMLNPGRDLRTYQSANRMLLPYGIGLSDGYLEGEYSPAGADDALLQTEGAMQALKKGGLKPNEVARAVRTVQRAVTLLPTGGADAVTIREMAVKEGGSDGPQTGKPITMAKPFSRLKIALEAREAETMPVDKVRAHPSAASFPGPVASTAKRISRSVEIDTNIVSWHGTGLYAAPGQLVTVKVPADVAKKGFNVRIGAQTDELWNNDEWKRYPSISRSWPLVDQVTRVASPFGGTVYIDVPEKSKLGSIVVTIDGAIAAPHFVRGKTKAAEWQAMLAEPSAPWVDIEGRLVILTVPRAAAETVKYPEALMAFWDEMMELCYSFYATPKRPRPERYCVDRQISVGYMHAGYPIMTWEDVAMRFCDLKALRGQGLTWGFFHEMGHNFQESDWTFDGTGEVTNNLFSLYASEKMNGITVETYGIAHNAMFPKDVRARLEKFLAAGAPHKTWQNDAFLALTMYVQLREAFGWEAFTKVFAEYQALKPSERPRSEQDKVDQWMVRFSQTAEKNLGPFFVAWGMPVSEKARKSIENLPTWMPADWPQK